MKYLPIVLLACVFGIAGCAKNELDRSLALPLVENSPEFKRINFIMSETVNGSALIDIVRGPGNSNCGMDSQVHNSRYRVVRMEQAEKYGLVILDEVRQTLINCTRTMKRATLTSKGLEANRGSDSDFEFRALTLQISQITGIKLGSNETSAIVSFGVKVDESTESYRQLANEESINRSIGATYTALLGLYDDGWRVERISKDR